MYPCGIMFCSDNINHPTNYKSSLCDACFLQVGMQNSSLGVILATTHFASSMVALPSAMSAVIMNIMGSCLAFIWRYIDPSHSKGSIKTVEKWVWIVNLKSWNCLTDSIQQCSVLFIAFYHINQPLFGINPLLKAN